MRQFILYILALFSILFLLYVYRDNSGPINDRTNLNIYASGSFISSWGPGPELKNLFEARTGIKINYIDMSDPGMTLQKVAFSTEEAGGDMLMGLDQFDIVRFADRVKWNDISAINLQIDAIKSNPYLSEMRSLDIFKNFIPYNWSAVAFVTRTDKNYQLGSLHDLLRPELRSKVAYEDPRTSSPGLQFLLWVARTFSEDQAVQFLKDINTHSHSFSPSWSTAYGLFKNKSVDVVLSYITSPIYHLVEEKDANYHALDFKEGLPLQVEFAGVLSNCRNCEAANKFIQFIQSKEAQRIIMTKNYMLPMNRSLTEGTAFDTLNRYKFLHFKMYTKDEINKWIRIWSDIRKNEG